jgi:lipid A 3-O-deacylase
VSRTFRLIFLFTLTALLPRASSSQGQAPISVMSLYEENDVFTETDLHYTQGLKLSFFRIEAGTPERLETAAKKLWSLLGNGAIAETHNAGWSLGQNIYTGDDIRRATINPDDRPWAGWLYVGRLLQISDNCDLDDPACRQQQHTVELDLGVVGPASGAKWAQSTLHKWIDSPEPQGWGNQLGNEPGLLLLYKGKWRFPNSSRTFDLIPHAGFAFGNVLTYLSTGGTVRAGIHLTRFPGDLLPSAKTVERPDLEAYLFGGGDVRFTAVNIFLDGNHFRDSYSVDKKPVVYDLSYGAAVRYKQLRVTYTLVRRSPEFAPRSGRDLDPQEFGSVVLAWER